MEYNILHKICKVGRSDLIVHLKSLLDIISVSEFSELSRFSNDELILIIQNVNGTCCDKCEDLGYCLDEHDSDAPRRTTMALKKNDKAMLKYQIRFGADFSKDIPLVIHRGVLPTIVKDMSHPLTFPDGVPEELTVEQKYDIAVRNWELSLGNRNPRMIQKCFQGIEDLGISLGEVQSWSN